MNVHTSVDFIFSFLDGGAYGAEGRVHVDWSIYKG